MPDGFELCEFPFLHYTKDFAHRHAKSIASHAEFDTARAIFLVYEPLHGKNRISILLEHDFLGLFQNRLRIYDQWVAVAKHEELMRIAMIEGRKGMRNYEFFELTFFNIARQRTARLSADI